QTKRAAHAAAFGTVSHQHKTRRPRTSVRSPEPSHVPHTMSSIRELPLPGILRQLRRLFREELSHRDTVTSDRHIHTFELSDVLRPPRIVGTLHPPLHLSRSDTERSERCNSLLTALLDT